MTDGAARARTGSATTKDLHRDVLADLGLRIASGDPPAGTVLTLAGLESAYGASRTVVREAVRVLESIRLVSSRRRVGITVQPPTRWDALHPLVIGWMLQGAQRQRHLESLMELRLAVEPTAAALAAERATPEQRAELCGWAELLAELGRRGEGQSDAYLEADIAYHALLLTASGNPLLSTLVGPVREELAGRTRIGMHPPVPAPGTLEEHLHVARAIADGDAVRAEERSRVHLAGVRQELMAHRRAIEAG